MYGFEEDLKCIKIDTKLCREINVSLQILSSNSIKDKYQIDDLFFRDEQMTGFKEVHVSQLVRKRKKNHFMP